MKKLTILLMLILSVSLISAQGKTCCKKGGFEKGKCNMSAMMKSERHSNVDSDASKAECSHESGKMSHQDHGISKNEVIEEKIAYYTCPMESHKHIQSAEPGKCPECGMEMEKAVFTEEKDAEFYGCPMPSHSHVRSDKPGKCDECGMTLKSMRLSKS